MKKIYSLLLISLFAVIVSCTDDDLDPLNFKKVKKGTLLALRGDFLQNIYVKGIPGAQFVPGLTDGSEKFVFDAEYLSEDPSTLSSIDVFLLDKDGQRYPLVSKTAADFTTPEGGRPTIQVSIPLSQVLTVLGFPDEFPISDEVSEELFTDYKNGITIDTDLNLTDGTKVTHDDLIAAGLYQSNQFYPAQRLIYTVVKYCPEDLTATYDYVTTVNAVGDGGDISGCDGGVTGSGAFEKIEGGYGIYSIPDATFGQYDCAWGDNPAKGVTLKNTCDQISIGGADQYALVYSFSNIQISPDGTEMSFSWENDYGDKGTTVLTRTDGGTWPTTLH